MTVVQVEGVPVDFGDMPLSEIKEVIKRKTAEVERQHAQVIAEEIAKAIPEPTKPVDHSADIKAFGALMIAIREELMKAPKDYSDAFKDVCKAVSGIQIPEPKDVDLSPVVKALKAIDPVKPADMTKTEKELAEVTKLLTALNKKDHSVVLPPEAEKPLVDAIEIVSRDSAGNAKRFEVFYRGES